MDTERLNGQDMKEFVCENRQLLISLFIAILDKAASKYWWAKLGIPIIKNFAVSFLNGFCDKKQS